jgi:signal transduction histidine kinase
VRNRLSTISHSLKAKLLLVFVVLSLSMAVVFLIGMQRGLSHGWRDVVRPLSQDYLNRIFDQIGSPPSLQKAQQLTRELPLMISIQGPIVNWTSHSRMLEREGREWHRKEWMGGDLDDRNQRHPFFVRQTSDGHRIELGLSVESWQERPRRVGLFTLLGLLLMAALAYWFIRRMLEPIAEIRSTAQRFGQGQFDAKIPVYRDDELGQLSKDLNQMGHNLEQLIQSKRALLLAMSHELRSPLTRAKLHAELLPDDLTRRQNLLTELNEMSSLISTLLESERLSQNGANHTTVLLEVVNVKALVNDVVSEVTEAAPNAQSWNIETANAPESWRLDKTRMRILLRNLLANASLHGDSKTVPSVELLTENDDLLIKVRDFGKAITHEQLSNLGEPFWRSDQSRNRDSGGVGLGLYLCKLITQAHRGTIQYSLAQPGLMVQVRLPRS